MPFVRFVVGADRENAFWLNGVITEARLLQDDGHLYAHESRLIEAAFDWFNDHLPCPPFLARQRSGDWSSEAVCWFRPEAQEPIARIWDLVWILREHEGPVRLIKKGKPGRIVYEDRFQIVAETPYWA